MGWEHKEFRELLWKWKHFPKKPQLRLGKDSGNFKHEKVKDHAGS